LSYVESVGSVKLANVLDKTWAANNPSGSRLNILVQVNTSAEESKDGVDPSECKSLVEHVTKNCPNLAFKGLMTIGRPGDESCFDTLVQVRNSLLDDGELAVPPITEFELSMGMSGDYEVAVRKGATSVRCGSILFGARAPKHA